MSHAVAVLSHAVLGRFVVDEDVPRLQRMTLARKFHRPDRKQAWSDYVKDACSCNGARVRAGPHAHMTCKVYIVNTSMFVTKDLHMGSIPVLGAVTSA